MAAIMEYAESMQTSSEANNLSNTLNTHTNTHAARGRPTLKDVERFRNGSVRELYERTLTSDHSIVNKAYRLSTDI